MSNLLNKEIMDTIDQVACRWDQADTRILRNVFPLLAMGRPVTVDSIAEISNSNHDAVEEALRLGRAQRNQSGHVVGLSGFGLGPTMHRIEVDGVVLFGCCALFSLMIPSLVAQMIKIESVDPVTRQLVRLIAHPDGRVETDPIDAAASLVTAELVALNADIGASFCRHIYFFTSLESTQKFASENANRRAVTIQELVRAAQHLVKRAWENDF
jgi:hypothetical protein